MKMYSLSCRDLDIKDCNFVAMGESKEEVLEMAKDHMQKSHPGQAENMMAGKSEEEFEAELISRTIERDEKI